ncbi:MAG TPA: serine/threonine-protein kinase, partial [Candidatus Binatia bacterium]
MLARVLQPGTVLHDRYHILRPIGKGGMGAVYEAIDLRLHNTVAVKHTTAEGPGIDQAFEREAQLLAALRHPALPVVIDYFVETQGRFLVMQYIDGEDLAALLKRGGPRNEADVEHWAVVVLQALKYLHGHNPPIIHRDIKPANLKLTPRGEILLLDFGLAKGRADQRTVAAEEELSVYGYTPHYAPLEQIEGRGTDARSDIYALGATLYHLISGTAPPGAIDRAKAVASGGADPLIAGLPQLLLDSGLRATILRALALDPAGRFSSAEEMAAAFVLDVPSPGAGSTYSQVTESRRLDAAMPSQAEVGRVVDLIVQVRFRDSPLLGLEEWPSIRTPDEIEQRSEPLHVDYPIDPRSGRKLPARLRVRLAAPDFEIQGSDERLIDVPPDAYSARLAFLLAPQRAGFCRVNVEVYAADTVFLGTIPIEAEAFTRGIKGSVIRVANLMIGVFIQPAASVRVVLSREQDKENAPSFSPDVASARERERPAELAYSELSRKQQEPVGVGSDGHAAWHDSSENLDREDTATVLAAPPTSAASAPSKTRRRVGRPFRLASLVGALATLTIWYARGAPVAPVESISLTPDALTEDATDARLAAAAKVAREEAQAKAESDAAKLDVRAITAARAQADARAASQAKVDAEAQAAAQAKADADARAAAQAKADADARAAAQAKADADARAAAEAEADARAEMAARDAQASSEHHQQDFQVPQQHQQQQQPQPEHNNVQQSQQHSNFQQPQQQGGGNHFQSPQQQQHGNSQQQGQGGGFHFQSPQQAQSGHQGNNAGQGSHGGFQSPQQAQSGHQGNYAAQGGHNGFQSPTSGDGAKAAGYAHDNQPGRDADTAGHDRENERGRGNDAGHGRENAPGQQKNAQAQKPQRTERQLAMKNGMQSKVQVDNRGRARAIQARDSKGDQLQVRNGLRRGDRTVEKRGADNQRIVSTGRGRGFTERSYSVNNKYRENVKYVQRTYVSENVTNVYAYR